MEVNDENREDRENENHRKESHREIEKQRRKRLKAAMMELARVLPGVGGLKKEPDKLTILKMASAHLRSLPGDQRSKEEQEFLFNEQILAEAADGFQFVMGTSGQILYVSESIRRVLLQDPREWIGQNIMEKLHPDDIFNFNEQVLRYHHDNGNGREKERILNLKTGTMKKAEKSEQQTANSKSQQLSSLLKCICRFKIGNLAIDMHNDNDFDSDNNDSDSDLHTDIEIEGRRRKSQIRANSLGHSFDGHNYAVIHLSGHIRNLCVNNLIGASSFSSPPQDTNTSLRTNCFVMTGRRQIISESRQILQNPQFPTEFMTRQNSDGILTFVDENVTRILGFSPGELLGQSFLQFFPHPMDQWRVNEIFQRVGMMRESPSPPEKSPWITFQCRCRKKGEYFQSYSNSNSNSNPNYVVLKTTIFPFFNPKSTEFEFILCTNTLIGQLEPEIEEEMPRPQIQNFSPESTQQQNEFSCACPNLTAVSPISSMSCYSNLSSPPELGTVARWEWENEQQELMKNHPSHI